MGIFSFLFGKKKKEDSPQELTALPEKVQSNADDAPISDALEDKTPQIPEDNEAVFTSDEQSSTNENIADQVEIAEKKEPSCDDSNKNKGTSSELTDAPAVADGKQNIQAQATPVAQTETAVSSEQSAVQGEQFTTQGEQSAASNLQAEESAQGAVESASPSQDAAQTQAQVQSMAFSAAQFSQDSEQARLAAIIQAQQAERARLAAQVKAQTEVEVDTNAQVSQEAAEQARLAAEAEAKAKAEQEARLLAEKQAAEEQTCREAEEQARREAEEQARREAEAKAKAEQEARLLAEKQAAEEQSRREAEEQARREAEEQARLAAEAEAKAKAEQEARLLAEKQAAEEKARREAEEQARREAEEQARLAAEAEAKAKAEQEARLLAEKQAAEEQARREAEEQARLAAEAEAQSRFAEQQARLDAAHALAREDARRQAEEQERLAAAEQESAATAAVNDAKDLVDTSLAGAKTEQVSEVAADSVADTATESSQVDNASLQSKAKVDRTRRYFFNLANEEGEILLSRASYENVMRFVMNDLKGKRGKILSSNNVSKLQQSSGRIDLQTSIPTRRTNLVKGVIDEEIIIYKNSQGKFTVKVSLIKDEDEAALPQAEKVEVLSAANSADTEAEKVAPVSDIAEVEVTEAKVADAENAPAVEAEDAVTDEQAQAAEDQAQKNAAESEPAQADSVDADDSVDAVDNTAAENAQATTLPVPAEETVKKEKLSFFARLKRTRDNLAAGLSVMVLGRKIDEELYEELETALLSADLGVETTNYVIERLRNESRAVELKDASALRQNLFNILYEILKPCEQPLDIEKSDGPFVILMVGVNGAGKTTTIGKLAQKYKAQGKSVMLAAGDTFRAAAVEQLQEWGKRIDVPVVAQSTGSDSASVLFDALNAARARKVDVLICDTAGRLQNKDNLMDELRKIVRVMRKQDESVPHETLLVLDAATGQNAVSQTKIFTEAVDVSGLVLTKLDGTAKGGVVFALADKFKKPIRYIGVGEKSEDLRVFETRPFVEALLHRD